MAVCAAQRKSRYKKIEGIVFIFIIIGVIAWGISGIPEAKRAFVDNEYEQAEANGDYLRLANMHFVGWGTGIVDKDEALKWFKKAARDGSRSAAEILCNEYQICEEKENAR
uniref:Putative sel1 repeat family protein n=1 Tax=viral metagenome TaxID=1070528 RepID=A0A6M3K9B1_9ZZZZ